MNSKPKILLVDDDEIAAMVVAEMIAHEYQVKHVASGRKALEALAIELPDLVLLDVDMPQMTGYEVCRALRANPMFDVLPVIFLSGMESDQDRSEGYAAGGSEFLCKPVSSAQLCAKIQQQLQAGRTHGSFA